MWVIEKHLILEKLRFDIILTHLSKTTFGLLGSICSFPYHQPLNENIAKRMTDQKPQKNLKLSNLCLFSNML